MSTKTKKKIKAPESKTGTQKDNDYCIVGVGASAGGLEALKAFFDNVPSNCKHSFVLVQHLSPDYKSLMAELLSKNTSLPIFEVTNNLKIQGGAIYLIPPKKNMTLKDGKLVLKDKPKTYDLNLPIDIFFKSLAEELQHRSIGIILSGTGTDGSRGVRAIKEVDGMVMVQKPETAKFDGMPNSAIAIGGVDYILPVEQIPTEMIEFIDTFLGIDNDKRSNRIVANEETLVKILNYINKKTNIDFYGYKRPTLVRRIERRISVNKCLTMNDYMDFLFSNDDEVTLLYREFLIGVTKFFRDTEAFKIMNNNVLPNLIENKEEGELLKAWSLGCSTGEEVYSIAILIDEILQSQNKNLNVKIFATDIKQGHIDTAAKGVYSESIVADVSPQRLKKYFIKKGDQYHINQRIRNKVIFSCHDALKDPPFNTLDLVVCRNMLIYIDTNQQQKIISKMHFALKKEGVLFLGSSESLGANDKFFETINRKWKIYSNKTYSTQRLREVIKSTDHVYSDKIGISLGASRPKKIDANGQLLTVINSALLDQFGAAGIYVDEQYEILHAVGGFKKYMELPEDQFSLNLLKMLPESLSIPTGTAIRKVAKKKDNVLYKGAKWRNGEEIRTIDVLVKYFELNTNGNGAFLVVFIEQKVEKSKAVVIKNATKNSEYTSLIAELEDELKFAKDSLQETIKEVEISNEELQTTNEELLSSNEELQSTNEELQSVNEELHTVNSEYQLKIEELSKLNNDIENLIQSTNIATIFLDTEFEVRKFTPNITEQFNLTTTDIGRPISHFTSKFGQEDSDEFLAIIRRVLSTGTPEKKEIKTQDNKWYLQRIFPFIDSNNKSLKEGVVITFVDINEIKLVQEEIQEKAIELEKSNETLTRFNNSAVGREERMIELKEIINQQCLELKKPKMFDLKFKENSII